MSDLKFDTEAFTKAGTAYEELAEKIEDLKNDLQQQLVDLTTTEWVSDASRAFMEQYQGTWAENVQEYVTFIKYLKELMESVGTAYGNLADKVDAVSFPHELL